MDEITHVQTVDRLRALTDLLELHLLVRQGGGWWDVDDPYWLDQCARHDGSDCPAEFPFAAEAVPALIEMLPWVVSEIERWANVRTLHESGELDRLRKRGS